ncbi:MAG TPA: hypothetical protein VFY93_07510 [Planctomycetota bacterium]|nr:hypothetical protein [Planctomycetota bacterium]
MAALTGASIAAEVWCEAIPEGDAYSVSCVLVPGFSGADLCGVDYGNEHVDFRVGFGADGRLTVNGADAGCFNPGATYAVTVQCTKMTCGWFANTNVVNVETGEPVYQQIHYRMPGAASEVRAAADDVQFLGVS